MSLQHLFLIGFLIYSASCQCHTKGESFISGLCYKISDQPMNYKSALNYCHGRSYNLAVVSITLQANFLASAVRTKTGVNEALFWIGLSRATTGSRFIWDDGTALGWSNFDSSFPKDNLYVAESVVNAKWRTLNEQQSLYFVCSYNPNNVTPGTDQPSTSTVGYDSSTTGYAWSTPATDSSTSGYSTSTIDYSTNGYDSTTSYTGSTTSDNPGSTVSSSSPNPTDSSTSYGTSDTTQSSDYYTGSTLSTTSWT